MKLKQYGLAALALVAAFSVGRFSAPKKVEIKEVERVVTRDNTTIDRNQNFVEVTKETRMPDGTFVKETRKEKETVTQTERQLDSTSMRESSKTVEVRPSFRVGGVYQPAIKGFQGDGYGLILEKRILSELYVGVLGMSDKTLAITLSLGF
jgi:hypothetical protein